MQMEIIGIRSQISGRMNINQERYAEMELLKEQKFATGII